jgi:small conductance mechanosensitive channel
MEELGSKFNEYLLAYGMRIIAAVLIFIIGRWLASIISKITEKVMNRAKVEPTLASFTKNIVYYMLLVFVIVAAINKLGIQTTSLIAVLGAAGLAIGLALQGSLANFAAGVLLLLFKPFKTGDFVETGGVLGTVEEIHIFNTIINSPDNKRIILPNAKITGDNIVNYNSNDKRRVDLVFGISYTDDIKVTKEVLERIISSDPRILSEPKPVVAVLELADSSVNLVCRPWVKTQDYWSVYFDVIEKGKLELEKSGITIPFPQRDVHLYQQKNA